MSTKRGLGFMLLLTLLLLIAFIYNNNLVYLLCFLLASLFFITILHTVNSLQGLRVKAGQSVDIFAGELAENILIVDNPDRTDHYSVQFGLGWVGRLCSLLILRSNKVSVSVWRNELKSSWLVCD
ncbi:hypothetical protein [Bathymodiolus platifrons methanotrophic gill symbiont]|uniref:hypothetical protein n=1 Tax=Bathymodiolus platifrons methanotrophic gill symbiont TaxID=113268 RepID=UPI001124F49B|nr:hypothetical protein [Bathymodiolus platifrons methanotrophic gill symbiont]